MPTFGSVGPMFKPLECRQTDGRTDGQTNGTENITSSANAGVNKFCVLKMYTDFCHNVKLVDLVIHLLYIRCKHLDSRKYITFLQVIS